jgi:hypothetical protein
MWVATHSLVNSNFHGQLRPHRTNRSELIHLLVLLTSFFTGWTHTEYHRNYKSIKGMHVSCFSLSAVLYSVLFITFLSWFFVSSLYSSRMNSVWDLQVHDSPVSHFWSCNSNLSVKVVCDGYLGLKTTDLSLSRARSVWDGACLDSVQFASIRSDAGSLRELGTVLLLLGFCNGSFGMSRIVLV